MKPFEPVAVIGPVAEAESVVPLTSGTVWLAIGLVTVAGLACVPLIEIVELRSSRLVTFRYVFASLMRLSGRVSTALSDGLTVPPAATVSGAVIEMSLLMSGLTVNEPGRAPLIV